MNCDGVSTLTESTKSLTIIHLTISKDCVAISVGRGRIGYLGALIELYDAVGEISGEINRSAVVILSEI